MNSFFSINPRAVGIVQAGSRDAALAALAGLFARAYELDGGRVHDCLEERERLGSTGFGRAVALPHARFSGLSRPVCAVARLKQPIDFAASDAMKVSLLFGLLSPEASGATHLHALAAISRLVREEKLREALIEAPDEEALYALLIDATQRDAA